MSKRTSRNPGTRPDFLGINRLQVRLLGWIFSVGAVVLVPWTAHLAYTLPNRTIDTHYRIAWVGFDVLLVVTIFLTAYYTFRMDPRVELPATALATLLVVDAWFDIRTSSNRAAALAAVFLALTVEIPSALFSIYIVRRINHHVDTLAETATLDGLDPNPSD